MMSHFTTTERNSSRLLVYATPSLLMPGPSRAHVRYSLSSTLSEALGRKVYRHRGATKNTAELLCVSQCLKQSICVDYHINESYTWILALSPMWIYLVQKSNSLCNRSG